MCVCVCVCVCVFGLPWCKESTYNAGDLGSNPVRGGPLKRRMAPHSSILAWRILWTEEPEGYSPRGHKESDVTEHLCI